MTITLKIEDSDTEEQLKAFIHEQKELTVEALKGFFDSLGKKNKFNYKKKDPKKHMRKIVYMANDDEDLTDVKPYAYVEDSAKYIHNLRRQRNR